MVRSERQQGNLEVQVPQSLIPFLFFFFLRAMENYCWTENRGLTVTSNENFKVRLQKCSLFLHRDLQMRHFPFTIFFLGAL